MNRATRFPAWAFALVILTGLFLPSPHAQTPPKQPPAPIPITDRKPAPTADPLGEWTDLGGGASRQITRNAAGQTITVTVIYLNAGVGATTQIESVYPDGKPAEVTIVHHTLFGEHTTEVVKFDSAGNPQEREVKELFRGNQFRRDRFNPKTGQWEPAPDGERWDPYKGAWEPVPDGQRFNADTGNWERQDPKTGIWEPVTTEDILEEIGPPTGVPGLSSAPSRAPLQVSAKSGYVVNAELAMGLSTTVFSTPIGRLRVNVSDDLAGGNMFSGTIYAEPIGKDQAEQDKNLTALRSYVVDWESQRTPASLSGPRTPTPFSLTLPAGATTSRMILRDKGGAEVARRDLTVMQRQPADVAFSLPAVAQQGSPLVVRGVFDGDFKTSRITCGGAALPILAESPRKIVAHNTTAPVGTSTCEITDAGQSNQGEVRTVAIALSAPKLELMRGEQTTVTVTVTGLEGLREPVPLLLENATPSIVRMSGGELQRLSIPAAQVQGGTYTTTRTLSSVQRGSFTINGTVVVTEPRPMSTTTRADLAIAMNAVNVMPRKSGSDGVERPQRLLYTITVTNKGQNGASDVVVTENLPPDVTAVSCTARATQKDERGTGGTGVCEGSGNTRKITFPFLAPGATATITILVTVSESAAPGSLINTADVTSATPDPDPTNNHATQSEQVVGQTIRTTARPPTTGRPPDPPPPPPGLADVQITKTALPTVIKAGDRITYSMTVKNNGPNAAANVLILDVVPVETTFRNCKATRGNCRVGLAAGGLVDLALPLLPNGATETLTVEVEAKKDLGPGTAIVNDAEVSSTTPDPNPGNNKDAAIVWVRAPIPLVVISEFRTRGPQGEKDEFIELYNRSNQRLDLSGWTVQVSNGSGATSTLVTIAPGTRLPARSHLLLVNSLGYTGPIEPDQVFSGDIADDGGIALRPLRGVPGDEVGMSNGSAFKEGAVLAPMSTNANQSYERRPGGDEGSTVDSNVNRADFRVLTPSDPQNRGVLPVRRAGT